MLKSSIDTKIEISNDLKSPYGCIAAEGIWYYDALKGKDNFPQIYKHLLSSAEDKVWIWDPYTNSEDHVLFKYIKKKVDVRCLTFWGCNPKKGDTPKGRKLFLDRVEGVQVKYRFSLEVKYYNIFKNPGVKCPFHDRYLFIDEDVYIVGSSMGYHHENGGGTSSTSIHLIKERASFQLVKEKFLELWNDENTDTALSLAGGEI